MNTRTSTSTHFALVDVGLTAVHDADDAELHGDHEAVQDVHGVRALVHQVELREHADGAHAVRVHLSRHFQS